MVRPQWAKPPSPPPYSAPAKPVIDYAGARLPKRRGLVALVVSVVAIGLAMLALLGGMSGPYLDPFAILVLVPLWCISMAASLMGLVSVVSSSRSRRTTGSDLLRPAMAANALAWVVLALSVLLPLTR